MAKKNDLPPNTEYEVKRKYTKESKPVTYKMRKSEFDYWSKITRKEIIEVQILINFQN